MMFGNKKGTFQLEKKVQNHNKFLTEIFFGVCIKVNFGVITLYSALVSHFFWVIYVINTISKLILGTI